MLLSRFALAPAALALFSGLAMGQTISPEGGFEFIKQVPAATVAARANVRPEKYQPVSVKWEKLMDVLDDAPLEDTPAAANPVILSLPRPDGTWEAFAVVESPVMEQGLAAAFPEIRTFAGQGLDDPASTVRLDYTPHGFHAQVFTTDGSYYVDPYSFGDTDIATSYWKRDLRAPLAWRCLTDESAVEEPTPDGGYQDRAIVTRRQFRLACAATVEYTAFHGGTAALGQAAIVTAVNRVNQIYERDLATRFVLVTNNQNLVYVTSDTYANNGSTADLTANQTNCDTVIGTANYDVGHVFQTGDGGVVGLIGALCNSTQKGRGLSGRPSPVNDPFVIDYVAHELGHQCGGRHCFNNCNGTAGDAQTYAYEPGSGVTIMAYAGICGSTNIQSNSDAMFLAGSLDLMAAHINSRTCDTETVTANNTPTVNGGPDYTIPKQTPFTLTATGSDPDGNSITYSWEQRDTTTGVTTVGTDNGTNPIQRTWLPTASPSRTLPRLSNLLANTTAFGEILPQAGRTLRYRVVARDNAASNGGTAFDDVVLTVNGTAGPFTVTAPNTAVSLSGTTNVTWNVASTSVAPVSCANVKISLSTDGGNTFPTVLVASTPNDGSEAVTLPSVSTTTARIKVEAVGNIFFDLSNANFTITPGTSVNFAGVGLNTANDSAPNGNNNGVIEPGENSVALTVRMVNSGTTTATGVTGSLTSLTPTVSIVSGSSAYPNMATGVQQNNSTPFVFAVSSTHVCGNPISLRLSLASAQGSGTYDFSLPTGSGSGSTTQTFSYTGAAVAIPDNNTTGVNISLPVSGFTGTVSDLNFRFDGTTCNATAGSTTVGLSHTWIGDVVVTLRGPGGTPSVTLIDRPGYTTTGFGTDANNYCGTVLDDEAVNLIESAAAASAPFTGSWRPNNLLSAFDGINPNGTWTLNVSDRASGDTGTVRAFSLAISRTGSVCAAPAGVCRADFNRDGSVDGDDVIGFFGSWDAGETLADYNADGSVDGDDVIGFFGAWDAGC
ncbi:MAG: reprolysin-like metallopeptidase [Phycisphaerales bacterium]